MGIRHLGSAAALNIASVERDTGLSKDTLRVWERRYGFPAPTRDPLGDRVYPMEQVDKLRLLRRLLDLGHRPGKIVGLPFDELQRLAQSAGSLAARALPSTAIGDGLAGLIDLLTAHRIEDMRSELSQRLLRKGLARFVVEVVAPLNQMVGEAWTRGALQIFEEHLYTEVVQRLLRNAITGFARDEARPRVLLTTLPQEQHGLGLLMAEAMFSLEGCRCVSLGVQTPVPDIVLAAESQHADIVALSFSSAVNPNQALAGLTELRGSLAASVEIWAGGACPLVQRRPPAGVSALKSLDEIAAVLQRWRQTNL